MGIEDNAVLGANFVHASIIKQQIRNHQARAYQRAFGNHFRGSTECGFLARSISDSAGHRLDDGGGF